MWACLNPEDDQLFIVAWWNLDLSRFRAAVFFLLFLKIKQIESVDHFFSFVVLA